MLRLASLLAFACLATPHAGAQQKLVGSGDVVVGFGAVGGVEVAALGASGGWLARVEFAGAPVFAVLRDGAAWLFDGSPLPGTVGGTLTGFGWGAFNGAGELVWSGEASLPTFMGPAAVLGFDGAVLRAFGDPADAALGFGPGSFYADFAFPVLNDARRVLVRAVVEDPGVPGFGVGALVAFDLNAAGAVVGATLLAAGGDALAGGAIGELATKGRFAWSNGGDASWWARVSPVKEVLVRNGALVAETGGVSPSGGAWLGFRDGLAQNDAGDVAFVGTAQGPGGAETLVVRNGALVVRQGAALPALPGSTFVDFTGARLAISADGRVAFVGTWSDGGLHEGVFVDDRPVVRFGVTQIGSKVVTGLVPGAAASGGGLRMRADGVLSVALAFGDGSSADHALTVPGELALVPGCFANAGVLVATGTPAVGKVLTYSADGGQSAGVHAFLGFATAPAAPGVCGVAVPGLGELLIADPFLVLGPLTWSGAPLAFQVPLPQSVYGAHVLAQAIFVDALGAAPGEAFRLTNAISLVVGL